jgi:hypothetical protein
MGQKTVNVIGAMAFAVIAMTVAVFCLPMHSVSFFTLYILRAMRIETHLLTVLIDEKSSSFCQIINRVIPNTCVSGDFWLQDVSQRFCAPAIHRVYPQGCYGFQAAFYVGIVLAGCLLFNAFVLPIVVWMLHAYINSDNHKRSYRRNAMFLLLGTTMQLSIGIIVYGFFVFTQLDNMRIKGGELFTVALKANEGAGLSLGYICCCTIVLVQLFMLAIWFHTKTSEEQRDSEIAERKLFAQEPTGSDGCALRGAAWLWSCRRGWPGCCATHGCRLRGGWHRHAPSRRWP